MISTSVKLYGWLSINCYSLFFKWPIFAHFLISPPKLAPPRGRFCVAAWVHGNAAVHGMGIEGTSAVPKKPNNNQCCRCHRHTGPQRRHYCPCVGPRGRLCLCRPRRSSWGRRRVAGGKEEPPQPGRPPRIRGSTRQTEPAAPHALCAALTVRPTGRRHGLSLAR